MQSLTITHGELVDTLFVGSTFLDVILSDLTSSPAPGKEVWAAGRALSPGGIANNAVGAARLGLSSALVTALGDDSCGDLVWGWLDSEPGVDLSRSRRLEGIDTALTVAISDRHDRSFISHGSLDPIPITRITSTLPRARASFFGLRPQPVDWVALERDAGSLIFAGVGWDERHTGLANPAASLADVDVFIANETESLAFTGADTVRKALERLAESVPLAVITPGALGATAIDADGIVEVPAAPIAGVSRDTTGAGDEFVAALMYATLAGSALDERLKFANVCAGLATRSLGGAASAPGLDDIARWYRSTDVCPGYGFLDDLLLPTGGVGRLHP